jgi:DNA-directed RNA polymerase beta' subunit
MSMLYQELAYNRVVSRVRGIQFCVMSEQEIRRRSVCDVTENQTFSGNEPVPNGLFDTRMGVIDNNRVCGTCHQRNTFCPGHFGHVSLARPVFYVQFFDIVRKLLQCVCFRCSKCLVNLDSPEVRAVLSRKGLSRQKRWEAMSKLCQRIRRCGQDTVDGCGAKKPDKVMKTDDMRIEMQWRDIGPDAGATSAAPAAGDDGVGEGEGDEAPAPDGAAMGGGGAAGTGAGRKKIFTAEDVLRILRRVSDEDAEALGFDPRYNRPEWMICTALPVPPPAVRPSVRQETGQRQEDDLTHKLGDIVKTNNTVRERIAKGSSYETVEHWVNLLQYHVATLIDNSLPSMYPTKDRAGRNFRSLCERLKHKEGRIRGNLMGKRVDFSARTVITPDPNLSIDELGVPLKIAMNLTFPEVVNVHNVDELRRLVCTGPDAYPGAKHVRKTADGNRTIRLRGHPDLCGIELEPGDVVERHLRNGDYVLFNRQPSLHKMSMMAHRVRVMEYNTFRLNVCVCACYNADFDGDEMNMHVPQSLQTHHELKELAAVPLHVISPRYSKPIITIVQDVALGVYRVTQKDVRISQRQLFNLVATNPLMDPSALPPPAESGRWTGRQVLSTVLPPSVSVRMASSDRDRDSPDYDPQDDEVVINNGVIVSGVLNTSVYGKESRGLVHATYNSLGPDAVVAMLDGTQKFVCDWLVLSGFSVGVSDLVVPREAVEKMAVALADAKANAYATIRNVHAGTFENVSTKSDGDFLEDQIGAALMKGMDGAGKVGLQAFPAKDGNRMLDMIASGSKGKPFNFTQMVACLGPQSIEQKRVPDGFDNRTLPHYTKYDDSPESRGFVEHSFIQGLAPHEFFFHSMAGRIGLIDTAVRTSETGYIQRKLVKAMEDCKIHPDLTVRNASGHVVQFLYGEDGMDAVKLEFQKMPYLGTSPAEMRAPYLLSAASELRGVLRDELIAAMDASEDAWMPRMRAHFEQLVEDRRQVITGICGGLDDDKPVVYPVNVGRIVLSAADVYASVGCAALSDAEPLWVLDCIDKLSAELRIGSESQGEGVRWMPVLLRCFLSPKVLLLKHRLSRVAVERVVQQVRSAFFAAVAAPSEMVGIVAAQSIGEPTTQLSNLKTSRLLICSGAAGDFFNGEIGAFVDALLEEHASGVVQLGGDSVVLDLVGDKMDHFIVGVSDDEKTSWRRISQISRHPANGGMVHVRTKSGKSTCATLSHSFLKRTESGVAPVLGSDLKVGDRMPIAKSIPTVAEPLTAVRIGGVDYELTRQLGWFFGAYLADGYVSNNVVSISKVIPEYQDALRDVVCNTFGVDMRQSFKNGGNVLHGWDMSKYRGTDNTFTHAPLAAFIRAHGMVGSHKKRVPGWMFAANLDFVRGVLCGYFDGDGNVNDLIGKQMIRSASVCEGLTDDFVLLLAYVGIFASKCREKHIKEAGRADLHTVQVARKHARRFKEQVGPLVVKAKAEALDNIIAYVEREDAHSLREEIDMIPELGDVIAFVGKALVMPGQSRLYGRYQKKDAVGRETLRKFVAEFEAVATVSGFVDAPFQRTGARIGLLTRLLEAGVPDKRGCIELSTKVGVKVGGRVVGSASECELSDQRPAHYATQVEDAMQDEDAGKGEVAAGDVLAELGMELKGAVPGTGMTQWRTADKIGGKTLRKYLDAFGKANDARRAEATKTLAQVHEKLAILRQAAESDVVWDEITELEYLPDPGEYVYDFTVPGNDSFMVDCGVLVHNTLNTFHFSGAATASAVTAGVPRMRELMSMSKSIKTPAMTIRLKPEWAASMERANEVASNVQTTCFRDLVKSSSVYFDPSDAETTIEDDRPMMKFYREFGALDRMGCDARSSPWLLRFELDRAKMLDLKVTMLDVEHVLTKFYADTVTCVLSDDNSDRLVCRLRLSATSAEEDLLTEIKALEQSIMETSVVKGVAGIHKAVLGPPNKGLRRFDTTTDAFVADDEWTIVTAGSNLMDVMRNDCVDYVRTTTNDVYEVYNVLGIEAARQVLIDELRNVLRDLPLDHRHLSLLADTMSNRGFFMSIDRHGINHRGELGPLAKCSFEETTDMLIKAGVFAERDRINGVSANIMLGQVAPCGTGDCEVLVDGDRLSRFATAVPLELIAEVEDRNKGKKNRWGNSKERAEEEPHRAGPALPALGLPDADTGDKERARSAADVKEADELEIV